MLKSEPLEELRVKEIITTRADAGKAAKDVIQRNTNRWSGDHELILKWWRHQNEFRFVRSP
jgi:hypothetical protein